MAGPFSIVPSNNTFAIDNGQGTVTFTVTNSTRMRLRSSARLVATPPTAQGWFSLLPPDFPPRSDGEQGAGGVRSADPALRDFAPEATQSYTVRATVPPDAPAGDYKVRLVVANEANPDDEFSESADITLTVAARPLPPPRRIPWPLIAVLVAILLLGGVAAFLLLRPAEPPVVVAPTATASPAPTATAPPAPTATISGGGNSGEIAFMSYRQDTLAIFMLDIRATPATVRRINFPTGAVASFNTPNGHNAWSPDGERLAFFCNNPDQICIMNADGTGLEVVTNFTTPYTTDLSWSADGNRLIYGCSLGLDATSEICQVDLSTLNVSSLSRLNPAPGGLYSDWQPDISPDGRQIVFQSLREGDARWKIYVMSTDGSTVTRLTDGTEEDESPDWSPDGARIAFVRGERLYIMDADGANLTQLATDLGVQNPDWSPDGTQIVYQADCINNCDIAIVDVATGESRIVDGVEGYDYGPIWRP